MDPLATRLPRQTHRTQSGKDHDPGDLRDQPEAICANGLTMRLKTAFPYFDETTLPAIPTGWRDISWRDDACPSFDAGSATVYVDHADPRWRRYPESKRFIVQGSGSVLLETDDWAAVIALCERRKREMAD
jgi:hypothetical protein